MYSFCKCISYNNGYMYNSICYCACPQFLFHITEIHQLHNKYNIYRIRHKHDKMIEILILAQCSVRIKLSIYKMLLARNIIQDRIVVVNLLFDHKVNTEPFVRFCILQLNQKSFYKSDIYDEHLMQVKKVIFTFAGTWLKYLKKKQRKMFFCLICLHVSITYDI